MDHPPRTAHAWAGWTLHGVPIEPAASRTLALHTAGDRRSSRRPCQLLRHRGLQPTRVDEEAITTSMMTSNEQVMTVTTILISSVYDLLPQIHDVIRQHPTDASERRCSCRHRSMPCRDIDAAIAALDLVLHIRLLERSTARPQLPRSPTAAIPTATPLARGLERLRAELTDGTVSPDACIALLTILASIDTTGRLMTRESAVPEIFIHGVLLEMLERAQAELAELDPER